MPQATSEYTLKDYYETPVEVRKSIKRRSKRKTVFVIMAFQKRTEKVYSAIEVECKRLKLRAMRVDKKAGGGLILLDTLDLIQKSEFIICDLTYNRPNVYYELGYAHGAGNHPNNTLLIARKGTKRHFNLTGLQAKPYSSIKELRLIIATDLKSLMNNKRSTRKRKRLTSRSS